MPTAADREAAKKMSLTVFIDPKDLLKSQAEHFAAHRRRERERIVGIVEDVLGPTAFAAVLAAIHQLESEA